MSWVPCSDEEVKTDELRCIDAWVRWVGSTKTVMFVEGEQVPKSVWFMNALSFMTWGWMIGDDQKVRFW